jgi:hypothetical protein
MPVKVISEGPVRTRKHVCEKCSYELEFCNVDLQRNRTDSDGDPIEQRGLYLVCPRAECGFRNFIG